MTKWVTVSQASDILGMSERTVRRYISDGKIQSKMQSGRRMVGVDVADDKVAEIVMSENDKDMIISMLRNELDEKNKQIEKLQEEIRVNHERSDAIIMKLADELEAQRKLLEDRKDDNSRGESLWQKIRRSVDK
ncbi:helix-turn-helix domain-containing protein [Candidatus Poribacteria bacterium]|nr:helix-turn-helix domain-containing protein [Candidatus Poribacteria bacterium]